MTPHPLKVLLHDLCRAVVREQIGAADLSELLGKEEQVPAAQLPIIGSNLADVLWFVGLELEADGGKPEPRKILDASSLLEITFSGSCTFTSSFTLLTQARYSSISWSCLR